MLSGEGELGEFLRTRRGALRPADVGIPTAGGRRRVPGLRREELAQLAGVSVAYYTRIEQGQSANASPGVLDAIARALELTDDERSHLHALARPAPARRAAARPEKLRPAAKGLIDAMDGVAAAVLGRRLDALAWNPLCHALFSGHLPYDAPDRPSTRPNWAEQVFLDPHTRDLFVDWERAARNIVGYLRVQAGRYPDDPGLAALVGRLTLGSRRFGELWAQHTVRDKTHARARLRHPLVGELELCNETLRFPDAPDYLLSTFYAEPGSPAEAALHLLAPR